ncbi:MAG: hypothetical protein VX733_06540 [Candidatus Latescibacterota bacterium]|nr:hypothetical protein [Candidatus Latescibacterota bacterium]
MIDEREYRDFRAQVDSLGLRDLKSYLDYGKRVRRGEGMGELHQWLGRILLDDDGVYNFADRARAFVISCCEWAAQRMVRTAAIEPAVLTVAGPLGRTRLLRLICGEEGDAECAALLALLRDQDHKFGGWINGRASALEDGEDTEAAQGLVVSSFLARLEKLDPVVASVGARKEVEEIRRQAEKSEERLRRELEAALDRAERAVGKTESLDREAKELRRSLRQDKENGEKLRSERSRRIKVERESRDSVEELRRLREEYIKLDQRLRETAGRGGGVNLGDLTQLPSGQLLGLSDGATREEMDQVRRSFAAVFHSDRATQLPSWVGDLFDQLLGAVNSACDRARR